MPTQFEEKHILIFSFPRHVTRFHGNMNALIIHHLDTYIHWLVQGQETSTDVKDKHATSSHGTGI
jgi:hypothetical protein